MINADLATDLFDISGWFLFGSSKVLCKAVVVAASLGTGLWICVALQTRRAVGEVKDEFIRLNSSGQESKRQRQEFNM